MLLNFQALINSFNKIETAIFPMQTALIKDILFLRLFKLPQTEFERSYLEVLSVVQGLVCRHNFYNDTF